MMVKVSEFKYPERLFVRKTGFLFSLLTTVQFWQEKFMTLKILEVATKTEIKENKIDRIKIFKIV